VLSLLRVAVVLISPSMDSGTITRSELLGSLDRAMQERNLKLIEMDPKVVERCGGNLYCISRERPPEVSRLLIITHSAGNEVQDKLTVQVVAEEPDPAPIEFWIDDEEQVSDLWRMVVENDVEQELRAEKTEVTLARSAAPIRPYARARNGIAWTGAVVASVGLGLLIYAVMIEPDEGPCTNFEGDCGRPRSVVGPVHSIGYGAIAGGATTSITAFVSSDDELPWWQPVVGALVMGVTLGITLLLDDDDEQLAFIGGVPLSSR
jgi:hypothetical protein